MFLYHKLGPPNSRRSEGANNFQHKKAFAIAEEYVSEKIIDEVRQGANVVSVSPSGRSDDFHRIIRNLIPYGKTDTGESTPPTTTTTAAPDFPSTEDSPTGPSSIMDSQTSSTDRSSTSEMSVVSTPTTSLISTDSSITPPPITSATDAATSTTNSSSNFEPTSSSSSQATSSSSDAVPTPFPTSSAAPLTSDLSSNQDAPTSPPASSSESSATTSALTASSSLGPSTSPADITSSQTTVTSDIFTSSPTETVSQTSFSDPSTIDSSQAEAPSSSATSNPSDSTSPDASISPIGTATISSPTTAVPETTSTTTPAPVSQGPNNGITSQTASSLVHTRSSGPPASFHHTSQDTGGDTTSTITSTHTSSTSTSSSKETHRNGNKGAHSQTLGVATDTNFGSSQSVHRTHTQESLLPIQFSGTFGLPHGSIGVQVATPTATTSPSSTPSDPGTGKHRPFSGEGHTSKLDVATDTNSESLQGTSTQETSLGSKPQTPTVTTPPQGQTEVLTTTASPSPTPPDQETNNNDSPDSGGQSATDNSSQSPQGPPQSSTFTPLSQQSTEEVQTTSPTAADPPSSTPSDKGDNNDGSSSGEQPPPQNSGTQVVTNPSTTTHGNNDPGNQGSTSTPVFPGTSSAPVPPKEHQPDGGSPSVHDPSSTDSSPPPAHNPDGDSSTLNGTPTFTSQQGPAFTPTGATSATASGTGPADGRGSVATQVPHPSSTQSHSETGQSESNDDGLISQTPSGSDTVSAHRTRSSATAESDISTSAPLVRLGGTADGMGDDGLSTYTTTYTTLETLFGLTTITTSPPPTTMTTYMPYTTRTEIITATVTTSIAGTPFRLSKGQIGGIIAGILGFFALFVAILIYLIRRKRKRMDFVLVSPHDSRYIESDAEMAETGDGHDLLRPTTQTLPGKASASDSFSSLPSQRILGYSTPKGSNNPSTLSFQHPSRRMTINSVDDVETVYWRSYSIDTADYSEEGHSVESDNPRKTHHGDVPFQPVLCKSPTVISRNGDTSDHRYGYAV